MSHDTITLDPFAPGVFDVHNWRPVTQSLACETLAAIAMTVDEPSLLGARADTLPDSRTRVTYYAHVKPQPFRGESVVAPYLILLHADEGNKQVWLVRQDVELAIG